jgi:replicative superfamily II helicase
MFWPIYYNYNTTQRPLSLPESCIYKKPTPIKKGFSKIILHSNTIVLLPTGSGKTWVAADAIVQLGKPAVFFVATIVLVDQQATALRSRPGMPLV